MASLFSFSQLCSTLQPERAPGQAFIPASGGPVATDKEPRARQLIHEMRSSRLRGNVFVGRVPPGPGPGWPFLSPIGLTAADLFAGGELSRANSRVHEPYGLTETGGLWATGGLTGSGSHVALSFCQSATLEPPHRPAAPWPARPRRPVPARTWPPARLGQPVPAPLLGHIRYRCCELLTT